MVLESIHSCDCWDGNGPTRLALLGHKSAPKACSGDILNAEQTNVTHLYIINKGRRNKCNTYLHSYSNIPQHKQV